VTVVWSDEPPRPPMAPEDLGRGRPRAVNGTMSYLPALFGLTLAGLAVNRILGPDSRGGCSGDPQRLGGEPVRE
jgi:tRNA threonylcarbamoyladenosine dehydratase